MKKNTIVLASALMLAGTGLFAGSLDHLSNQSAKWIMTTSRNASVDGADIVQYNPAGTAWLSDGLHLDLSGQTLFKQYSTKDVRVGDFSGSASPLSPLLSRSSETLNQDRPTPFLPNLHLAYNFGKAGPGKLAAYMQAGVVAGGGGLNYENGTAGTMFFLTGISASAAAFEVPGSISSQKFEAWSVYYAVGVGASYAFPGDMASVSLGGRAVMARRHFDIDVTYSARQTLNGRYEYAATGFTPIVGVDVRPNKDLTLAARFEAPTAFEFEYEEKKLGGTWKNYAAAVLKNAGIEKGKKFRQDLPAVIGLGAEYMINDRLAVDLSGTIYLLSSADLGYVYENGNEVDKINNFFDTGYEIGFGAKYKVLKDLKIGAGFLYTESGSNEKYLNDPRTALNVSTNPTLDSITLGSGATYNVTRNMDLTFSFMWGRYMPKNLLLDSGVFKVSGKYTKDAFVVGYGLGYKF